MDDPVAGFPGFEVFRIRPIPSPDEQLAILEAIEEYLARQRPARSQVAGATMDAWTVAGRLAARRGGLLDARTALGQGSWAASAKVAFQGRQYVGRSGRGDQA
ncbi:MAG TPA: hypothetical protein VFW71_15935 [Actinomycetota bacterium]|nr:hypothetical protein [Actinomycetota bacterium]